MKKGEVYSRYPSLSVCEGEIERLVDVAVSCVRSGGKILLCGNGGSSADCEHIAGELLKGFRLRREMTSEEKASFCDVLGDEAAPLVASLQRGVPAIPLPSLTGVCTAYANDASSGLVFAQEVFALGRPGDLLIGITTSGNSSNVVAAMKTARAVKMKTAALTGSGIGKVGAYSDVTVRVPETETYKVQELHLPVYHYLCARVEEILFGEGR